MSEDFNDVIKNLSTAIDILKSNANTIKILSSEHSEIKNFASSALDKANDLEKDINVLKSGVSRNLKTNYLETNYLKSSNILSDITFIDSNNETCGSLDASVLSIPNIKTREISTNNLSSTSITANQIVGEVSIVDKENLVNNKNTTKLTSNGIYVPNDVYVYNNSTYQNNLTYKEVSLDDVEKLCENMHIYLDASLNKYFLKFDDDIKNDPVLKPVLNDNNDYNLVQMLLFAFVGLKQKLADSKK